MFECAKSPASSGCRTSSQSTKSDNELMILSTVCRSTNRNKTDFLRRYMAMQEA